MLALCQNMISLSTPLRLSFKLSDLSQVMTKKQVREEKKQQQVLRERIAMTHASKYENVSSTFTILCLMLYCVSDREGAEYFVKLHCAFQNSLHLFFVMEYIPVMPICVLYATVIDTIAIVYV